MSITKFFFFFWWKRNAQVVEVVAHEFWGNGASEVVVAEEAVCGFVVKKSGTRRGKKKKEENKHVREFGHLFDGVGDRTVQLVVLKEAMHQVRKLLTIREVLVEEGEGKRTWS